jgi:hypothetical protein
MTLEVVNFFLRVALRSGLIENPKKSFSEIKYSEKNFGNFHGAVFDSANEAKLNLNSL